MEPQLIALVPEDAIKVTYAKNQPEYLPLEAILFKDGKMYTEWKPTEEELKLLLKGEHIRLWVWTFNQPLQPIALEVTNEN
jgi:hypothetical protein